MRRSFDPIKINAIINDPEVFKWIKTPGLDKIDATDLVFELRNYFLIAQGGVLAFIYREPGVYEVHNNFLLKHRGRNAFKETLAALKWMFARTDCMILQTRVPSFNRGAELLARAVGGTKDFDRLAVWPCEGEFHADVSYWSLKYEDWLKKTPSLIETGRKFHNALDIQLAEHGVTDNHADEDCHDLYVGACIETIRHQPEKAIMLYNRWARFAGYETISLVSKDPLIIDIASAILLVENNTFRIMKCR